MNKVIFAMVAGLALRASVACYSAENTGCDPGLVDKTTPTGYQPRSDRCEGFYARSISSRLLPLVSFYDLFLPIVPQTPPNVTISWNRPAFQEPVRIQATGIGFRIYYRMDKVIPAGDTKYIWPLDVLSRASLEAKFTVGLCAWLERFKDGPPAEVYLPIRVSTNSVNQPSAAITAVFVPSLDLDQISWSLSEYDPRTHAESTVVNSKALDPGPYFAGRPLKILISRSQLPHLGIYRLAVTAIAESSKPIATELWFTI